MTYRYWIFISAGECSTDRKQEQKTFHFSFFYSNQKSYINILILNFSHKMSVQHYANINQRENQDLSFLLLVHLVLCIIYIFTVIIFYYIPVYCV